MKDGADSVVGMRHTVRLRPGFRVELDRKGGVAEIVGGRRPISLAAFSSDQRTRVARLSGRGCNIERFIGGATAAQPALIAARLVLLKMLAGAGLLRYGLALGRRSYLEAEPLNARFEWKPQALRRSARYRLAPAVILRQLRNDWLLEATLAHVRIYIARPECLAMLAAMTRGVSLGEIASAAPSLGAATTARILTFLVKSGVVVDVACDGVEDWRTWAEDDLLFHRHTRFGFFPDPVGSSRRKAMMARSKTVPPVARAISIVPLPSAGRASADRALSAVLSARRSRRSPGRRPIDVARLSVFLSRVVRDIAFPRFGGLDVFDYYLAVGRCSGVAPGLYRYRPRPHALETLAAAPSYVQAKLGQAGYALGAAKHPPDLVVKIVVDIAMASRAYDAIAYRLALLNAGMIMQTMYLVATALSLAPCAIGSGDSLDFSRHAGIDPRRQDVIAEFALSGG
jgi:SagB-type dehydrogenase family enzyme